MKLDQPKKDADKKEAEELRAKVLNALNRVPKKVNEGSHNDAVAFKKAAAKAMTLAKTKSADVVKMRQAWNLISGYYRGDK